MTPILDRRTAILSGLASCALPSTTWASGMATRRFRVERGGSDIGTHTVSVMRDGDGVRAQTVIAIAVKILGITAYRYELDYTETYRNGVLQSLVGTSNDDGERGFVRASRDGDILRIEGSGYTGDAPGNAVPTSYWRRQGLNSTPWISTQSGLLLNVGVNEIASTAQMPAGSRVWRAADQADYSVDLWYDSAGEWTGCAFDASGETGVYILEPNSDSLAGLTT